MACSVNLGYFVPVHLHPVSKTAQYFLGDNALLLFPLLMVQVGFCQFLSSSTGTGPKPISTVPYPGSHDLCCPIRETSALAWEKMCPQEAMRQELPRQPWPPKMKATDCMNGATTAEVPTEKQNSGDTTRNLALEKVSSRSAPRLLSWVSQHKASLYSSLVDLGWVYLRLKFISHVSRQTNS